MQAISRLMKQLVAVATGALLAFSVSAAEIHVMTSGGFTAAYKQLVPEFEKATGHKIVSAFGASQGGAPDSIPERLKRGEQADVVILASGPLDKLIAAGHVKNGSRVDLVRSSIGMVVRAGAPKPDISTVEALKKALLEAQSVAYSASASGVYIANDLYPKLGIAEQMKDKSQRIVSIRVGTVVARGDAELGFQQISELLPIPGVDFVGPLPESVQKVTLFSAGVAAHSTQPELAQELIRFFNSAQAAPTIAKTGLEPLTAK